MKRKLIALTLAAAMTVSMCACGNNADDNVAKESSENKVEESKEEVKESSEAAPAEKETVSILLSPDTNVVDYETNLLTQMIEEKFNVDLEFVYLPATEAADKLALMLNSGEELPDVVCYKLSSDEAAQYGTMGVFLPLNDYIEDISVNMKRYDELYPDYNILKSITSYDGNIYTIPNYSSNHISNELRYKYWINQDWLDAVGMSMPTTTEEFYAVLKAFKEKDPNGNGIADEIPLIGSTGWSADVNKFLVNAFGYCTDGNMLMAEEGEVKASYAQDYYKGALEYINKLAKEGLLDTTSYSMDLTQMKSLINNEGTAIVGCFAYTSNDLITEDDRKLSYVGLAPLEGPEGYKGSSVVMATPSPYWYVTEDAKNPELAFLIGDYLFDEDMYCAERYGIEGENWEYTDESAVGAYEKYGFPSTVQVTNNIWTESQNVHWRCGHPCLAITIQYSDVYATEEECAADINKAMGNNLWDAIGLYQENRPSASYLVGSLSFTAEERDSVTGISADLKTFASEQTKLFITGERDLSTWDKYLEELEQMGLPEYLEAAQAAYERVQ